MVRSSLIVHLPTHKALESVRFVSTIAEKIQIGPNPIRPITAHQERQLTNHPAEEAIGWMLTQGGILIEASIALSSNVQRVLLYLEEHTADNKVHPHTYPGNVGIKR